MRGRKKDGEYLGQLTKEAQSIIYKTCGGSEMAAACTAVMVLDHWFLLMA